MFAGIGAGFLSVLFICGSYIFSREYVRRFKDPVKLAVISQLFMAVGGLILLGIFTYFYNVDWNCKLLLLILGQIITFLIGQTAFFAVLRRVESSRAAALLGLKILALALIAAVIGRTLQPMQWLAVVLCTAAAVGMSFSGGRILISSCIWLFISVLSYALCDMCVTELMLLMPGKSMLVNSFGVVGICYTGLGIAVLPALFKYKISIDDVKIVLPYSLLYFASMVFLYTSFGAIGVVFGSIIQAVRGVVSVLLGVILVHYDLDRNEHRVSIFKWVQRFVSAAVMLTAVVIYSLS